MLEVDNGTDYRRLKMEKLKVYHLGKGAEDALAGGGLLGAFNVSNLLAAAGTLSLLGMPWPHVLHQLEIMHPVPGRMHCLALTRGLITTSDFLRNNWLLLIIAMAAVIWGLWWLFQKEGPRRRYHEFLLRMPIAGRLTRGINTARFTRTFSILAGSGVPVLEAMKISAEVIENLPMREAVNEAALRVREGAGISRSLAASKLFPPMMIHLISSGEAGGRLEEMLARSASGQEREVDGLIAALLGILQPLLIVAMGAIVMVIVLAILLPIFEINNLIR